MRKTKQNNKIAILDKFRDSIVSEEVDSMSVEDLTRKAAELIERIERIIKSKKKNILTLACNQGII